MAHLSGSNADLIARVRRIAGQVGAVERGLTSGDSCATVLHLVAAVRGAVNGLMDEAMTVAGVEALEPVPVDLAAVAARVADEVDGLGNIREIRVSPSEGVVGLGSEEALRTVLHHLLDNASRYAGPEGQVELRARATAPGSVELTVTDDGPGLEDPASIFDAFAKGAASTGHGLGLHVVRTLVEGMGGSIRAENRTDGHGARFVITLEAPTAN